MISKTEIGGGKELPGCEMELYDEENNFDSHAWEPATERSGKP